MVLEFKFEYKEEDYYYNVSTVFLGLQARYKVTDMNDEKRNVFHIYFEDNKWKSTVQNLGNEFIDFLGAKIDKQNKINN